MATKHRSTPEDCGQHIPAAAYYRMSTDEQKESIAAQALLVERFAADHDYRLLHAYIDEGIPGDATAEDRPEFQRMLADAQRGDFQAVLVRDTSRLTRSDSIDGAEELRPLKRAGVVIVTSTGLRIDLRTMEGRIMLHMGNEISNGENRNRAVAVTNGQLQAALNGSWIGSAPFAYRIEGTKKNKRLVLGHPEHVATIRRIFAMYDAGVPVEKIRQAMMTEGVPTAQGGKWNRHSIVGYLSNPVYCGDYVFNKRHYGKYLGIVAGRVTSDFQHGESDDQDLIIHRDHWPAIVSREQWERVQKRIEANANGHSPCPDFMLSTRLRCDCGHEGPMYGRTRIGGRQYFCPGCRSSAFEGAIIDAMTKTLAEAFTPKSLADLETEIRKQLGTASPNGSSKVKRLESELAKQERKLVILDADCVKPVQDEIRRLRRELDEARQSARASIPIDSERIARRAVKSFGELPKVLKKGIPNEVRQALDDAKVTLRVKIASIGTGPRRRYQLESGDIHVSGSNAVGLEPARLSLSRLPTGSRHLSGSPSVVCLQ